MKRRKKMSAIVKNPPRMSLRVSKMKMMIKRMYRLMRARVTMKRMHLHQPSRLTEFQSILTSSLVTQM